MVRRTKRDQGTEVVYIERGDSSAKWLFWGACLGAGLALMYAPRSGEETRRSLQRNLWKLRAMTEEKLDELTHQIGERTGRFRGDLAGDEEALLEELADEETDDELESDAVDQPTARDELERRLAEARARRRAAGDLEEPLA